MTQGLVIDAPPERGLRRGFARPTVIPPVPGAPISFRDLAGLAAHIQRLRRRRGLELRAGHASWNGSDTFPIFKLWWLTGDEHAAAEREYGFAIAVQGASREALEAAIAAANPADLLPRPRGRGTAKRWRGRR